jgi:hypothetical protein
VSHSDAHTAEADQAQDAVNDNNKKVGGFFGGNI